MSSAHMNLFDLTPQQLKRAASIKEQIDGLNRQLRGILGAAATPRAAPSKNRTMSASVKKKIAATQKARWGEIMCSDFYDSTISFSRSISVWPYHLLAPDRSAVRARSRVSPCLCQNRPPHRLTGEPHP